MHSSQQSFAHRDSLSLAFSEHILFAGASIMASSSILTFIAQNVGMSFHLYSGITCLTALLLLLGFIYTGYRRLGAVQHRDTGVLVAILIVGAVCVGLVLIAHYPSIDDYNYLPNVVRALQYPDAPMNYELYYFDTGGPPIIAYSTGTSVAFEYVQGALAYLLGIDFLYLYYTVFCALGGFLLVIATYALLSHFVDTGRNTIYGLILILSTLLILTEVHITYGNLMILRIYQGKFYMLAIGLPTLTAFSLRYFTQPTIRHWLAVFAVVVAMLGTTTSTVFMAPALAGVLFIAAIFTKRITINSKTLLYFGTMIFPVLYALFLKSNEILAFGTESPVNQQYPMTLQGQLELIIRSDQPVTLFAWLISLVLFIVLVKDWRRRFVLVWIGAAVVFFINPWSARLLIDYVTTPNVYWRMFYILPFPLIVGIGGSELLQLAKRTLRLRPVFVLVPVAIFATLAFCVMLVDNYFVYMGTSPYKLFPRQVALAHEVVDTIQEATILAPPAWGPIIPVFGPDHRLVSGHPFQVRWWMSSQAAPDDAEVRIGAGQFVSGDTARRADFLHMLDQNIVDAIIMTRPVYDMLQAEDILLEYGFDAYHEMQDSYVLVWQSHKPEQGEV